MFRRDSNAASSWQKFGPEHCVPVQREILESADKMLRPGGYLIYSTCSFSVSENESMIAKFMTAHENYELLNIDSVNGLSDGLQINDELTRTVRIWPHQTNGDGHFCALLQKQDQSIKNDYHFEDHTGQQSDRIRSKTRFQEIDLQTAVQLWHNWTETSLSKTGSESINRLLPEWNFRLHKNRLHFLPASVPVFPDIKFVKTGMMLGSFRQHRSHKNGYEWKFEPSHSLFLALKALDFKFALKLPISDSRLLRYLKGESIALSESDIINMDEPLTSGAVIVICLDEFPVGQARLMPGNILKNLYPPAWRKLL
jgi:NOL1/NOP2/fmu family ribosome biogenesis protein